MIVLNNGGGTADDTIIPSDRWGCGLGHSIWGKLRFLCDIAHCREGLISIFKEFCAGFDKIFILGGVHWALGYNSINFTDFLNFLQDPTA